MCWARAPPTCCNHPHCSRICLQTRLAPDQHAEPLRCGPTATVMNTPTAAVSMPQLRLCSVSARTGPACSTRLHGRPSWPKGLLQQPAKQAPPTSNLGAQHTELQDALFPPKPLHTSPPARNHCFSAAQCAAHNHVAGNAMGGFSQLGAAAMAAVLLLSTPDISLAAPAVDALPPSLVSTEDAPGGSSGVGGGSSMTIKFPAAKGDPEKLAVQKALVETWGE